MKVTFDRARMWKRIKDKMLAEMIAPNSQHIANIHNIVAGKIVSRTKSGVDIGGIKFQVYSEKYAKKKGYSAADLTGPAGQPLTANSGAMLARDNFKYQVIFQNGKVIIRVWMEGTHSGKISVGKLASVHNFGQPSGRGKGFDMPKREFFGIDKNITKAIKELSEDKWRDIMRSLS